MIHLSGEINRLAGYRSALLDMGMELDDALVPVHANDRDYDRGAVARAWSFRTDRHLLGQFTRLNVPRARPGTGLRPPSASVFFHWRPPPAATVIDQKPPSSASSARPEPNDWSTPTWRPTV